MSILGLLGGMAVNTAVNAGQQAIGNSINWHWQKKQNEENARQAAIAREDSFYLNEKAAQNADARQRSQFADLYSPQAKMMQMKEAGISPAMALANGMGSGGQATGSLGGTNGGQASGNFTGGAFQGGILDVQTKQLQNELIRKQIEKMDIENKKEQKGGINYEKSMLELDNQRMDNTLKQLEVDLANYKATMGYDIAETDNAYYTGLAQVIIAQSQAQEASISANVRRECADAELRARKAQFEKIEYEAELTKKQANNFEKEWSLRVQELNLKAAQLRQQKELFEAGKISQEKFQQAEHDFQAKENELNRDLQKWSTEQKLEYEKSLTIWKGISSVAQGIAHGVADGVTPW